MTFRVPCLLLIFLGLAAGWCRAEEPPDKFSVEQPIIHPVVLRVSREWFESLTSEEFSDLLPVSMRIGRVSVSGTADVSGRMNIDVQSSDREATFVVRLEAVSRSSTVSAQGPARVYGHADTQFWVTQHIVFDGFNFRAGPSQIEYQNDPYIDGYGSTLPGLLGRIVRRVAARRAPRSVEQVSAVALGRTRQDIEETLAEEVGKWVEKMNQLTPLDLLIEKYFPETTGWVYRLKATETALQASLGPPEHIAPTLPRSERSYKSPIELWIDTGGNVDVEQLEELRGDVAREFESDLPVDDDGQVILPALEQVGPWVVLSLGKQAADAALKDLRSRSVIPPSSNGR